LSKLRFYAVTFLAVLFTLSGAQICIDRKINLVLDTGIAREKAVYSVFIEIEDKTLYLLENGKPIKEYVIASGKSGYPTPLGSWVIVEKGDWGEGFGGSWLGLNVPWGKYGIHGTLESGSIGYATTKGCIRMFNEDVAELYRLLPIGTEVVIVNGKFGPFGQGFADIMPGDRGSDVLAIQRQLKKLGYYEGELDGIYEDQLKKAVHAFQRANGLMVKNTITRDDWLKMGFREFE